MREDIYIIGAGGHGQVVADALIALGMKPSGFLDDNENLNSVFGIPIIGPIKLALKLEGKFVVAIGNNKKRKEMVEMLDLDNNKYLTVIHPSAIISKNVKIGHGSMILGGVVINTGTEIGNHVIINTLSSVDHHNKVGDFVHIAPGTHTGGNVHIEEGAFLGIGVSVLPGKKISKWSQVGAGAVVIGDILPYATYVGVPAKLLKGDKNESSIV